jgi:hypothetical protein
MQHRRLMQRGLVIVAAGLVSGGMAIPAASATTLDPDPTTLQIAADPQMLDPTADSTTVDPTADGPGITADVPSIGVVTYKWNITNVAPSSDYRGSKHKCIIFSAHTANFTYNCNIANSTAHTVTVTLSASFPIQDVATVSLAVGYSVTKTTSVSGGFSRTIKRDRAGWLWWAPVMSHRQVTAFHYWCEIGTCHRIAGTSTSTWTHHFIAPTGGVHFSNSGGGGGCGAAPDAAGDYEFGTPSNATVYGVNSDTVVAPSASSAVTVAAADAPSIPCG